MSDLSAAQRYSKNSQQVQVKINKLQTLLAQHATQQAADPKSYAYAGDLAQVREQLDNAIAFLTGDESLDAAL